MSFPRLRVSSRLVVLAGMASIISHSPMLAQQVSQTAPLAPTSPMANGAAAAAMQSMGPAGPAPASATSGPVATSPVTGGPAAGGPAVASGSVPQLTQSPMSQLKAFQPDENEEYTLGGGDDISVQVAGRPELSGKYMVGPDGRISLPTVGTIDLGNMTREQAADAINKAYGQYYNTVAASVSIDKYGSNRVLIVGAVEHPGIMVFDQTPTLLEAVTRAGGLQTQVTPTGRAATPGQTSGDSIPEECTIYRQSAAGQQVLTVKLRELLTSGNPLADLRLRRNDKIVVPDPHERFVSVLGEVKIPGPVVLTHTSTLPSVIAQAGGLTENAGGNATITIVDPATGKSREVKFKSLLTPEGVNEVALKPGELIVVPKSGLAKMGFVFQQLSPMTSMMSMAAIAAVQ
jgi:polysaccharide export outer membrane protein